MIALRNQINFFFRHQFMLFNMYLGFLQYLQFTYQKGCLYRLRSLGERNDMDITIDGFHSWMWKGKFVKSIIYVHTLHKCRGLYLMKCHREILQNSSYFWSMKIYVFFKGYLFCTKVACFINKKKLLK